MNAMNHTAALTGQTYTAALVGPYNWNGCWPLVNRDTLRIEAIVAGDDDLSGYTLADVRHGKLVNVGGEQACDVLVAK